MGTLVTFYSYKGGVGRTMALANIAVLLARWGKKVLIVDWDLEAPGVEHFFLEGDELLEVQQQKGLIDLLTQLSEATDATFKDDIWSTFLIEVKVEANQNPIHLLTAGSRSESYFSKVRKLDVKSFYEDKNGGYLIEALRKSWKEKFDFVLVDSRTGITDIGGICTIQLPDILALVFTATEQSLTGAVDVAKKAAIKRQELPFDRSLVPAIPIPSRFDTQTEHAVAKEWMDRFEKALDSLYKQWLPTNISRKDFLTLTKIPYTAFFSFGESLPVIEQGIADPTGLGYAYETVAALIGNKLQHADLLVANRDEFVLTARLPSRLPQTPLRDLHMSTIMLIDFVGWSTLKAAFERNGTSSKEQENIWNRYHLAIGEASKAEGGELAESDGHSFSFAFKDPIKALRCALAIQESMVVRKPIVGPEGPLRVRIAIHASLRELPDVPRITELRQIAALMAGKAQEGEILISSNAYQSLNEYPENVKFEKQSNPLEFASNRENNLSVNTIELYKVVKLVPVSLTQDEREALFGQDPGSRGGGGFQALLVALQDKVKGNQLELTLSDRERIARYAHDYRSGGWQGVLKKIFGRILGANLGREM